MIRATSAVPQRAFDIREHGLFSMLRAPVESSEQRRALLPAIALFGVALVGFMAISGAHLGADWRMLGPLPGAAVFAVCCTTLGARALFDWRRRRGLALLALMLASYLLGNLLSGVLHQWIDPRALLADRVAPGFIASRLLYAFAVALPMLLVWRWLLRGNDCHLGFGDWRATGRLGRNDRQRSWGRLLLLFVLLVALPLFLLMQAMVDFGPLRSGRLPALALPLLFMALSNAFAEELLFRGLLQGAATPVLGIARGLWAVGILFGLHHLGASFDPIASLPGALAIGVGSVLFGKSVVETRGLGWAVCAHAAVNVALFSAYYVKA